ncbi:MAG: hypothetical protein J6Y19_01860 [Kiritimatiellae bacterium]|jgi:L-2-hydroxyglutarate oxidase LhgO|nr:hypothetical protein [Kiritimatiellia bacterium]
MEKRQSWKKELRALSRRLGALGMVTHGTVQDRGHGPGGPVYQWTRKEKGKTVSVALSREQYEAMKAASENWKAAKAILREMEILSRREIFQNLPGVNRRNPLPDKTLGLI